MTACGCDGSGEDVPVKAWGTAEMITNTNYAGFQKIAMNENGNAIIVWVQIPDNGFTTVWARRYAPETGWENPELLSDSTWPAHHPQIAIDGNGNGTAVWEQWDESHLSIWAKTFKTGIGWAAAQLIEIDQPDNSEYPKIAMNKNGQTIVVWSKFDGIMTRSIWANTYSAETGWGTAQLIENDMVSPEISINDNGNAIAVWNEFFYPYSIWANQYTSGIGWGSAQLIENNDNDYSMTPQIGIDKNGKALALWVQGDGIWANWYNPSTGWGSASLIQETGNAINLNFEMDENGNVFLIWVQWDGAYNIWTKQYQA